MKKNEIVAYAMDFCSFLVRSEIDESIRRIILFGSVAREDFDEESDIDIFIDTKKGERIESSARRILKAFELSETNEKWRLKGLKNVISIQVGTLEEWKLYRSVIANSILLYGRFEEVPKNAKYYSMFVLNFGRMNRNKKIGIWREFYGYRQKVGKKTFVSKGLLEKSGGKKIERSVIAVPSENRERVLKFIKRNKVGYKIFELWTDGF